MRPGVVSVMVAWKVAWFIGGFHKTWMSNAANRAAWMCSGRSSSRPDSSGSLSSKSVSWARPGSLFRALS